LHYAIRIKKLHYSLGYFANYLDTGFPDVISEYSSIQPEEIHAIAKMRLRETGFSMWTLTAAAFIKAFRHRLWKPDDTGDFI
jgi:hypothetical protein